MANVIVIYHKECRDGFCAAWVVHHHLKKWRKEDSVQFIPAQYGEHPPKVTNQDVIIVDFSYPRSVLESMAKQAASIRVFDHHANAASHCEGLSFFVFDNSQSGCQLAAAEFGLPDIPYAGEIVNYVGDRDLWKFQLPNSRAVNAAIWSYPYSFKEWDALATMPPSSLNAIGEMVARAQERIIYDHVRHSWEALIMVSREDEPDQVLRARICNATSLLSEVAEGMNHEPMKDGTMPDFSIAWFEFPDGSRGYSLRSVKPEGMDVSVIARMWGGNGHRHAAGCKIKPGEPHPWLWPMMPQERSDSPDHV